jgi:hypothetical protein
MHEFFFENLRNPARVRRAGAMRQVPSNQLNSIEISVSIFQNFVHGHHAHAAVPRRNNKAGNPCVSAGEAA